MATFLTILVVFAFLVLSFGVGYLWLKLNETARREALQALAARRGWALTISEEKLGRPGVLRLMPRGGPAWTVETRRLGSALEHATPKAQATEFITDEPRWPDGVLLIGPPLPEGSPAVPPGTSLDSDEGRRLLTTTLGPSFVGYAPVVSLWPSPPTVTVFASQEPVPRFDLGDIAKLYASYGSESRAHPVILFGREGLRVHLPYGLRRADQMERFIDLALEAGRIL